jgi:myo-inositol-1-phosphate synthase
VEDSPNSAGETIDAIRCCRLARDRGLAGPLEAVSAYTMKHPPVQFTDWQARQKLDEFISAVSGPGNNGDGQSPPGEFIPQARPAKAVKYRL